MKEHHRKKDKEQKKLAKSGKKPREPKDPGIPADWPFKAELIKELEFKKQQILAKEQAKKDAKKLARVRHMNMQLYSHKHITALCSAGLCSDWAPQTAPQLTATECRPRERLG